MNDDFEREEERTTRRISNEVYERILASGLLKGRRAQVYRYVCEHGPVTAPATLRALHTSMNKHTSSFSARFGELCAMDLLEIVGEVIDSRSTVSLYAVTGRPGRKLPPGQRRLTEIGQLRLEIAALKLRLSKWGRRHDALPDDPRFELPGFSDMDPTA